MAGEGDTQVTRVYLAEDALRGRWTNEFGDNAAAQAYVDSVIHDRWFQQRWSIDSLPVGVGRNLNGRAYGGRMTLSPDARNRAVALHEITHEALFSEWRDGEPETWHLHNANFCGLYLHLLRRYMGTATANTLRNAYMLGGVKHDPADGVVPLGPRYRAPRRAASAVATGRAAASRFTPAEAASAAEVLRRAARDGAFGPAGAASRRQALATAKRLDSLQ